jgi:copper chaperone
MIAFEVRDMTCGHCVKAITEAVKTTDARAEVRIDLASHRVEIEPGTAGTPALMDAIREAGYTPVPA